MGSLALTNAIHARPSQFTFPLRLLGFYLETNSLRKDSISHSLGDQRYCPFLGKNLLNLRLIPLNRRIQDYDAAPHRHSR
ncbi:Uncharacterised protein [Mycobacteroides abscessus subsp. abscessus]|nr:Uncharacterised protein [Mycobacteroides abscessus subsp. abscessus]